MSLDTILYFFSVAQPSKSDLGRLVFEVYTCRPKTIWHTHTHARQDSSERVVSPLQRPLSTRQTTNNRWISTLSAGFEHAIPGIKRLQTNDFDRTATGTDFITVYPRLNWVLRTWQQNIRINSFKNPIRLGRKGSEEETDVTVINISIYKYKVWGTSWPVENILASQDGLYYTYLSRNIT